ncbi:MAG: FAD-dependent oxidoreductase [Rubrivivax sp.]|jgi:NADPH-dependent 2,4-dienoyl-CoA reductase/sulfur reductase-like enzyme|nr:FAD-dependent oxidoreductase [Rubrivivax sp.]
MIDRRLFLKRSSAALSLSGLAGLGLTACGGGQEEAVADTASALSDKTEAEAEFKATLDESVAAQGAAVNARVIVIGGGMAGATVAKYLRLWGNGIEVTLVERAPVYTSCIMSSLVLTGQRTMGSLQFRYDTLRTKYGIKTEFGDVVAIDPVNARVTLASGKVLTADRIVLAPGIEFDTIPGLSDPLAMPHAWKAGESTSVLARQLAAMPTGGTAILTIPKAPYRCPPGPYERACLVADWMTLRKPRAKLIVLDANPDFVTERDNFSSAFLGLHGSVIEYHNLAAVDHVDMATRSVFLADGTRFSGHAINLIPTQRAPALVAQTGLVNDATGRFAKVNVLDYASTVAPRVHIIGDASATTMPKAGHIANQEAKVCADALSRIFAGGQPDPAPVTNSACYSTITMKQASWLHAMFQYDPATAAMKAVADASGASTGWNGDNFDDMGKWFKALMADSFA